MLYGLFFWLIFIIWEYLLHGDLKVFWPLVAIRFCFGGPWLIAILLAMRTKHAKQESKASILMALGVLGAWIGLLWMVRLTDPYEAFAQYIPGFALVLFFHYTLCRQRWLPATMWGIFYTLLFNINQLSIWLDNPDARVLDNWISASIYFVGFIGMGGVISYQLEWYHWNEQLAKSQLLAQNEELAISRRLEQEAKIRITAAANDKAQFLIQASHDLRQPMLSIDLFVSILQMKPIVGESKRLLNILERSVRSMDDLFRSMLDINRLDAGTMSATPQDVYLPAVLEDLADQCRPIAEAKGLELRIHNLHGIWISSDPTHLRRILRNLILNSIQYTVHGGIILAARRRGETVVIEVWDSGIGIAPDQRENIFKPYIQLPKTRAIRKKGLGLGLAIARGMAELIGTQLEVRSRQNKGSVFTLKFDEVQAAPSINPDLSTAEAPFNIGILQGTAIAIVENEADVLEGLEALIKEYGGDPISARGTNELIQRLDEIQRSPRLLISDIELDGEDTAWDVIATLTDRLGHTIPTILISGSVTHEYDEEARRLGMKLIQKPFETNILITTIVQVLTDETNGLPDGES